MSWHGEIVKVVETRRGDGDISSFELRIPNFLSLAGEKYNFYACPFDACDWTWCLFIYPYGLSENAKSDWVSLCLCREDEGPPKTLNVTLGIRGPEGVENKKEIVQEFSDDDNKCHWHPFCQRSKLREQNSRLMPGNILTLTLDMKRVVPSVAKGVEELQKSFRSLLACGEDSDVIIKVKGKEFRAHRAILRARSAVFQAMFAHDMVEKQSGVVNMEDCDPESFQDFLEHVYTGSFGIISSSNVFSLFRASDKYDLGALKQECSEFIKSNMSVASFCEAITLSIKHNDKSLVECATEFFCNNSVHIIKTAEWQIFLSENSTVGNELFVKLISKHEDIFVPSN